MSVPQNPYPNGEPVHKAPYQPGQHGQPAYPPNYGPPQPGVPPAGIPPKQGMPVWAWLLIGCMGVPVLMVPILAAILFPVFAQAREKARQTACLSNQKQVALGVMMYAQDYDETYPRSGSWQETVYPYTKNEQLFFCPSHKDARNSSYALNAPIAAVTIPNLPAINETILFFEANQDTKNAAGGEELLAAPGRHGGSRGKYNNFAFADGHCKAFKDGSPLDFAVKLDPESGTTKKKGQE